MADTLPGSTPTSGEPQQYGPPSPPPESSGPPAGAMQPPAPVIAPNAPDTSSLVMSSRPAQAPNAIGAQAGPTPEQIKHHGIGKMFATIVGGDQKPGAMFRGILAGAMLGGAAAGDGSGGFLGGFARGGNAVTQDMKKDAQLKFEDQLKKQKEAREQLASQDEHQEAQHRNELHKLSLIQTQKDMEKWDEDHQDAQRERASALDKYYASNPHAVRAKFAVGGEMSDTMPLSDFMSAATKNPKMMYATDPKNQTRTFVIQNKTGSEIEAEYVNGQWLDKKTGELAHFTGAAQIHAYDMATESDDTPQHIKARDWEKASGLPAGTYKDPNQDLLRSPKEMKAASMEAAKLEHEKAGNAKENAEAGKANAEAKAEPAKAAQAYAEANKFNAEADKARKSTTNPSIADIYEKYNIPQGASGQEVLKHLPGGLSTAIDKLAHYDWDAKTFNTWIRQNATGMTRQEAMTLASLVNPNYKEELYQTVQHTLNNYNDSKKEGGQMDAFNRFLGHAGEALDVTSKWRTSNIPALNTKLNTLKNRLKGDSTYTQFIASLTPVRKEYNNFLNQNRAEHEADLDQMKIVLSDDSTPAQIEEALKYMAGTAVTQARDLDQRFRTLTGYGVPNIIQPYTRKALNKLSDKRRNLGAETEDLNTGGTYYNASREATNQTATQSSKPNQVPDGGRPITKNGKVIGYYLNNQRTDF